MMKKLQLFTLLNLVLLCTYGQRYKNVVFDSIKVTPDLVYGINNDINGKSVTLMLDVYEPFNDTIGVKRPLLVLAHGGSFVQGSRKSADMVTICTNMAKRGYVVASIQYRLGINIFSGNTLEKEFSHAVWRATQDGRAAIRWFNRNAADTNTFSINKNLIFTGGVSAGGVLGMHLAFLDKVSELAQTVIDTNLLGGIEGNSGTAGFNWRVNGVVNLCGAINNINFMPDNKNVKLCSMHGTNDQTVPYKTDYFYFLSGPVAILQGSYSIDSLAKSIGIYSDFYTFNNAPHVPFIGSTAYMDTTLTFVANSLYNMQFGKPTTSIYNSINKNDFTLYPVPATQYLMINAINDNSTINYTIFNVSGIEMKSGIYLDKINIEDLPNGTYFIKLNSNKGLTYIKFNVCH